MIETIPTATDAVAKLSQYGLAAVCIIQMGVLAYLIKIMASIVAKNNKIIAEQITASVSVQQSLKDVVANNTAATEKLIASTDRSCDVIHELQCAVAACPKK